MNEKELTGVLGRIFGGGRVVAPEKSLCPDENLLGLYIDGALDSQQKAGVDEHLLGCSDCRAAFIDARQAAANGVDDAGPGVRGIFRDGLNKRRQNVLDVVASVVRESLRVLSTSGIISQPQPLYLSRSGTTANNGVMCVRKDIDQMRLELDVELVDNGMIELTVTSKRIDDETPYTGLRASIFHKGRERASIVMESGKAVFEYIPIDNYSIRLTDGKEVCGEIELKMEGLSR